MNKESNAKDIKEMVRKYVSCNESDVTITITTVDPLELKEGNFPVSIKAQDKSGNVGSCQVMCEIKSKKNLRIISDLNRQRLKRKSLNYRRKLQNLKSLRKKQKEKQTKEKTTKKVSKTKKNVKQTETTKSSNENTTTIAKD